MKKENTVYTLNKVDGFNPYEHIEVALDRFGDPIKRKTGEELKYLSTTAKTLWFRLVHPTGRIDVRPVETSIDAGPGFVIRYRADIYFENDVLVSSWEHQSTVWDLADIDSEIAKVQTIVLGKALSRAGFGCEVEMILDLQSEGEQEESREKATRPEPKKKARTKKAPKESTDDLDTEISDLLKSIDEEQAKEQESLEEKPEEDNKLAEQIEVALDTVISCKEKAPVNISMMQGQTLRSVLESRPTFLEFVKKNKNVREALSEETVEAALFVLENRE